MLTKINNEIKKLSILILLVLLMAFIGCGKAKKHVETGKILLGQGKIVDATLEFEKAIEKDPNLAEAYFGLGNAYVKRQMLEEAIKHYRKAIE